MSDKEQFGIQEASQIIGVQPHVLRYWEVEFPQLAPERDQQGWRVYSRKEVDILLRIRELLYEGKHTIEGARQELARELG